MFKQPLLGACFLLEGWFSGLLCTLMERTSFVGQMCQPQRRWVTHTTHSWCNLAWITGSSLIFWPGSDNTFKGLSRDKKFGWYVCNKHTVLIHSLESSLILFFVRTYRNLRLLAFPATLTLIFSQALFLPSLPSASVLAGAGVLVFISIILAGMNDTRQGKRSAGLDVNAITFLQT